MVSPHKIFKLFFLKGFASHCYDHAMIPCHEHEGVLNVYAVVIKCHLVNYVIFNAKLSLLDMSLL